MFIYSLNLAITNLRNRFDLTVLTISLIAIGLALLTTLTTMSYQTSKIPLKDKSENLHLVMLDSREKEADPVDRVSRMPWMTYIDAKNILEAENPGIEKTYLWKTNGFLNLDSTEINPRQIRALAGLSNFFTLFEPPMLYGRGWSEEEETDSSQVIVLSYEMNQHFFGGENSVGQFIKLNSTPLRVIGVMAKWTLPRRFYDRSFSSTRYDDVFIPSSTALEMNLPRQLGCWEKDRSLMNQYRLEDVAGLKASECRWLIVWAQLEANEVNEFKNFVNQYVEEQKTFGRIPRELKTEVVSLIDYMEVLFAGFSQDTIFGILAWLFFAVCLVNTIGLLLAKYMGKIPEIALRRALGAKKVIILSQYLMEIAMISFMGGILGLVLSHFGLIGMMHINLYASDYTVTIEAIKHGYQLDMVMISRGLLISVGCTLLVSLLPVWKICNTPPASQLKAQ